MVSNKMVNFYYWFRKQILQIKMMYSPSGYTSAKGYSKNLRWLCGNKLHNNTDLTVVSYRCDVMFNTSVLYTKILHVSAAPKLIRFPTRSYFT